MFFLIFPPHLIIYGHVVKTVYFFIVLPGLVGILYFFTKWKGGNIEKTILQFMVFALIYLIVNSGLHLFIDLSIPKDIMMGFIIFFSCFFYVHVYYYLYGNRFVSRILIHLNIAGIIQAIIVIATFLYPDFKNFLYQFIAVTETSNHYLFGLPNIERFQGIVPSGFSFLSTTHAFLLVFGIWGIMEDNKKYSVIQLMFFYIGQIIILISIGLIGRSGFIVVLLFLFVLILIKISAFIKSLTIAKKTLKLLIVFILIFSTTFYVLDLSKYQKNFEFAFELVISYTERGELDFSTSEVINHQYFFPTKPFELLFGTGNFGRNEKSYINSDVGYVLFVYGAGILGMLIAFGFYFTGIYFAFKYRRISPNVSQLIIIYLFCLIILNFKDVYYISPVGYSQIFFILICIIGKKTDLNRTFHEPLNQTFNPIVN